jgi:hypothetical protein
MKDVTFVIGAIGSTKEEPQSPTAREMRESGKSGQRIRAFGDKGPLPGCQRVPAPEAGETPL